MALPLTLWIQQQPADEPPTAQSLGQPNAEKAARKWTSLTGRVVDAPGRFYHCGLALRARCHRVRCHSMTTARLLFLAFSAVVLAGCGRQKVEGVYRDEFNPALRYELRDGGDWSAEVVVEVPAGVFPYGADRKFSGLFTRRGDLLELVCSSAEQRDPISGDYRADDAEPAQYNHLLLAEEGALLPVDADGRKEALFATDLNPLGARKLIREGGRE